MSRVIPTDVPLSDEDRQYLVETSQGWKIAQIDNAFRPAEDDEDDDGVAVDSDISDFVEGLSSKTVVEEQLTLREIAFESGTRDELNATFAIALQEKRSAGEEVVLEVIEAK